MTRNKKKNEILPDVDDQEPLFPLKRTKYMFNHMQMGLKPTKGALNSCSKKKKIQMGLTIWSIIEQIKVDFVPKKIKVLLEIIQVN